MPDGNPGDGVCAAPTFFDRCTLRAAIQEANALGSADVHLPAGNLPGLDGLTVTGDVALFGEGFGVTTFTGFTVTVAPGAKLALNDVGDAPSTASPTVPFRKVVVGGSLVLHRSSIVSGSGGVDVSGPPIDIRAGGGAVIVNSMVGAFGPAISSYGNVAIVGSTLSSGIGETLYVGGAGSSGVASTILPGTARARGCGGTLPDSSGYNRHDGTCGLSGVGDGLLVFNDYTIEPGQSLRVPVATSSLVDAVPVGVAGCSASERDLFGNPRGVDGNGDGIGGCDIGAVELQPAPAP